MAATGLDAASVLAADSWRIEEFYLRATRHNELSLQNPIE